MNFESISRFEVIVPTDMKERIKCAANHFGISMSALCRLAIEDYLSRLEELPPHKRYLRP